MKKNLIKILVAVGIIALVVLGAFFVYRARNGKSDTKQEVSQVEKDGATLGEFESRNEEGGKVNISSKLNEEKEYKGLKISNINLSENNGETVLIADVENISGQIIEDFTTVDIKFVDKDNNEIGVLTGLIKPLEIGETTELNASITTDLANAYDFEILEHTEE